MDEVVNMRPHTAPSSDMMPFRARQISIQKIIAENKRGTLGHIKMMQLIFEITQVG
jgi:hypothetical protein